MKVPLLALDASNGTFMASTGYSARAPLPSTTTPPALTV
ncbi:hypothetical protein BC739_007228 [Kutzneria viridogrisea]|uniref:Uncharacterized protein n=1 Tax=Kutzneria viridogrisea TaxID=47990 RepID=A0ABR6BSU4_9PSEU|nr:hypothetical protein [Kutzneria viridogrisea]